MDLNSNQTNDGNPSNFNEMPFNNELLLTMYNTPSKELSTKQIAEIISNKLSTEDNVVAVDNQMVSAIYKTLGESLGQDLDLRKRLRVAPKPEANKPPRVTKADILDNIFGQLGLNNETPETESPYEVDATTPQEQEWEEEAVYNNQTNGVYN